MLHMVQWLDAQGGWGGGDRRGDGFRGRLGDDQFLQITQLELPAGNTYYSYTFTTGFLISKLVSENFFSGAN